MGLREDIAGYQNDIFILEGEVAQLQEEIRAKDYLIGKLKSKITGQRFLKSNNYLVENRVGFRGPTHFKSRCKYVFTNKSQSSRLGV